MLEMTNGSMLKTGKIDKRASVMKTTQVAHLRLLASSQAEAQEWVSACCISVLCSLSLVFFVKKRLILRGKK
jgi:hypothetical protein